MPQPQLTDARRLRFRSLWFVPAAVFWLTGVLQADTLEFNVPAGTLGVEVDDPSVNVSLDGEELKISGAGPAEVRLKTGAYLFWRTASGDSARNEVLSLRKEDRIAVRVWTISRDRARAIPQPQAPSPDQLLQIARQKAGELVDLRNSLDERVWSQVSSRWTTTEAAKLLIAFFRGDGSIPDFNGSPLEAMRLRVDLARLRAARAEAFGVLAQAAREDARRPASPLVGTWEVTEVHGAGGIAADALELYAPDPVGRKFVATNGAAGLLTGAGFWLFDASYPGDESNAVDLSVVVRGNTIYHGRYQADQHEATLRLSPMNSPRPSESDGEPTDGGFVLSLRRIGTN